MYKPSKIEITIKVKPSETLQHTALLLGFYLRDEHVATKVCANNQTAETIVIEETLQKLYGQLHVSGKIKFGDTLVARIERQGEPDNYSRTRPNDYDGSDGRGTESASDEA